MSPAPGAVTSQVRDTYRAPVARRAFVRQIMGMPVSIHVRDAWSVRPEIEAAVGRVFDELEHVDRVLSTWRADSDLLRLQHDELVVGEAHPWVAEVTELCLAAEERTDGLFRAWRPRAEGRSVFDPTGLVKGWAVAAAAGHLEDVHGITFSIGVGGDVVVGAGRGGSGAPAVWRIGIEDPRAPGAIAEVVSLTHGAIATSGASARGAHIVDPRTGQGIARQGSTTVIGPDLLWADVWATAAFVDPERTRRLMGDRDPAYRLIVL